MKFKVLKTLIILICVNITLFNYISADKRQSKAKISIIPTEQSFIQNVIFDLGEVLFTAPSKKRAMILLSLVLRYPALVFKLCTTDIKKELFEMLSKVPCQPKTTITMYHQDQPMPQIMTNWMVGYPSTKAQISTLQHISTHNYSDSEKALFSKIVQLMFQPDALSDSFETITPMVKLAKALKAKGYKLYVLSNWDKDSFPLMKQKHSEIFELFDGIMISGNEEIGKPDPEFYNRLFRKYNLNPKQCLFIDDEPKNVNAAHNVGIGFGILKLNKSNYLDYLIPSLCDAGIVTVS